MVEGVSCITSEQNKKEVYGWYVQERIVMTGRSARESGGRSGPKNGSRAERFSSKVRPSYSKVVVSCLRVVPLCSKG